ncbi:MAG: hypothetical protein EXS25_03885 [Pedosphaera sp.]|nr:hypothetical protein [Pedosphaera sp.]
MIYSVLITARQYGLDPVTGLTDALRCIPMQRTLPLPNSCLGTGNRRTPNPVGQLFFPPSSIEYYLTFAN